VARAFTAPGGWRQPVRDHPALADGTSEVLRGGAAS
jgi:hypothetical protein